METRVILFDLGGVLVELEGPPLKAGWLRETLNEAEIWQLWGQSPWVESFESGQIGARDFAEGIIADLGLKVGPERFLEDFRAWPKGLYPGAAEYLAQLRKRFTLACYSNTSELHWPRMMHEMGLEDLLDHTYASFLTGCYKPAREGFDLIVGDLQVEPGSILFFDDSERNVEAAKKAGLKARLARGLATLKSLMQDAGLTPD